MQLYASLISGRSQLSRVSEKGGFQGGFWDWESASVMVQITARPHREACQSRSHSCSARFGAKHLTLTQVEKTLWAINQLKLIPYQKKKKRNIAAPSSPVPPLPRQYILKLTKDSAKNMYFSRNEWSSWKWSELKFLLLRERSCPQIRMRVCVRVYLGVQCILSATDSEAVKRSIKDGDLKTANREVRRSRAKETQSKSEAESGSQLHYSPLTKMK